MTLKEYMDQNQTFHAGVSVSAEELHNATFHVRDAIYERITRQMVIELAPLFREEIERNIDWARIRKSVEDAIIAQAVQSFRGPESK